MKATVNKTDDADAVAIKRIKPCQSQQRQIDVIDSQ